VLVLPTIKTFELIQAVTGKEDLLMKRLMKIPQVKESHLLAGKFDVMAALVFEEQLVDSREQIFVDVVAGKIRKMPIVKNTSTIVPAMSRIREVHLANPERRAYAFVFMATKLGKEQDVMNEVLKIDEVAESHLLLGKSDVLAVLQFEKMPFPPVVEKAARIVTEKIAKIPNLLETQTLCPIRSMIKE
jgi:DNA-binding Lrp family transcriptional regulator